MTPLYQHERRAAAGGQQQRAEHGRRGPAEHVRLGHGEHQRGHGPGDEQRAADVEPAVPPAPGPVAKHLARRLAARLAEQPRREQQGQDADRHVHQEHGPPASELDQHAAQHLARHEAHRRGGAVHAQGTGALRAFGKAGRDQGEGRRGDQRGAGALHHARGDEQKRVAGQPAGQRRRREDQQPGHEHAAPAEYVRGASAQDQQATERDRVSGHDPLHRRRREAEFSLDRRQGHVHDAEVQDDHERGGQDERQAEPAMPGGPARRRRPGAPGRVRHRGRRGRARRHGRPGRPRRHGRPGRPLPRLIRRLAFWPDAHAGHAGHSHLTFSIRNVSFSSASSCNGARSARIPVPAGEYPGIPGVLDVGSARAGHR